MALYWNPTGALDIATDPAALPDSTLLTGGTQSGAMQRCQNLALQRDGRLDTRHGSTKLNATAMPNSLTYYTTLLMEDGHRYAVSEDSICKDEAQIGVLPQDLGSRYSALVYNAYNSSNRSIYLCNGTYNRRVQSDTIHYWGIEPPATAPTLAVGSSTGLTGDYNARYTYCIKEGDTVVSESNPSPAPDTAQTLSNQSLKVTFAQPTDPQVTHVRLYRTLTGGAIYYWDQDLAIGGDDFIDSDTVDGELGSEVNTDHDVPPLGTVLGGPSYNGYLFMVVNNQLRFSKPRQPDYWPDNYYVEVSPPDDPGKSILFFNSTLYYVTKHRMYYISGSEYTSFFPMSVPAAMTGAQNPAAAITVAGKGIYHVGPDGLYLFNGSTDTCITNAAFGPLFRGQTVNDIPAAGDMSTAWVAQHNNLIYFGYPSADDTYPAHFLVIDTDNGRAAYYTWGREFCGAVSDKYENRMLMVDTDGYCWHINDETKTTDDGTAIPWAVETKDYVLPTRAHFPRFAKYDVDASSATSAIGYVVLDGAIHQTHVLTGQDRQVRPRLVATGNGTRCSIRVSGTGPVTISMLEAE